MDLKKKIKDLEKRVELLEGIRNRNKAKDYADFIMSFFEDEDVVLISDIRKVARKKGYSWQMISRAKRELLNLEVIIGKGGEGWSWKVKS